ncbi:MAG TPA: ribosomal protein S18-alanine N-acetyltransferase [Devosiaceae bacterium]|nr:ribosomal protein S18-alanine N-acetyltransferase [Devosiaceae bacterium]
MRVWPASHGLHVEPARPEDAERLATLHAASFFRGWSAPEFAAWLTDQATPGYVVCDARRRIAGFAMLRIAGQEAEILTVAIEKRWRDRKLGTALLRAVIDDLTLSPVTTLFLEVDEHNAAARSLYARFGFVATGTRRDYYRTPGGRPAAALVMRLDLG